MFSQVEHGPDVGCGDGFQTLRKMHMGTNESPGRRVIWLKVAPLIISSDRRHKTGDQKTDMVGRYIV